MRWFGESWGAPCCAPRDHVATPVGTPCLRCDVAISDNAQGIEMPHVHADGSVSVEPCHLDCFLASVGHARATSTTACVVLSVPSFSTLIFARMPAVKLDTFLERERGQVLPRRRTGVTLDDDDDLAAHLKRTDRRPAEVFVFRNGMAVVYDQFGKQMPELQGPWNECAARIYAAATPETRFSYET